MSRNRPIHEQEEVPDHTEPTEGDLVTNDHLLFWEFGMNRRVPVLRVNSDEDWKRAVRDYMAREAFWPNVFFLSDHGNWLLLLAEPEPSH